MLEFGNDKQIADLKEKEQGNAIDEQIEALQTALYCKENLSKEHTDLLCFLEGATLEIIEDITDDLQEAIDKAVSALKDL